MKIMIAYATKSGATKECAELLAERLGCCEVYDLKKEAPSPEGFDLVILGSGVRIGRIYRPLKNYIKKNIDKLLPAKTAIYLCRASNDSLETTIAANFPQQITTATMQIASFGGLPPYKKAARETWLNEAAVNEFVNAITK